MACQYPLLSAVMRPLQMLVRVTLAVYMFNLLIFPISSSWLVLLLGRSASQRVVNCHPLVNDDHVSTVKG